MNQSALKRFAQETRKKLISQIDQRLEYVISNDDAYLRAHRKEKQLIEKRLEEIGQERLLEEVAYTWFNRISALLYMDNRHYNRVRIVTPVEGQSQPELLSVLKNGEIPEGVESVKSTIIDLLDGKVQAEQPDREAYKTALLAYCNYLGGIMPFLFKKVDDWAALLLPTDLLSTESVIFDFQQNIAAEDCEDIEIIGWLYQFYISEKKDEVFADLKKNKKITPEDIPAATQLFTPHWIVRYLVENSLGRLWLLNNPESDLIEKMDYYIKPEEAETDFLKSDSVEDIRICDPACGSGHMLVYAFDLLFAMYEEEGYTPTEIPELILTNNLYGVEIDERAGELAAFALTMKAHEKDRCFLQRNVQPNICVLQNVKFDEKELQVYRKQIGDDVFSADFITTLKQFEEADNFGSLIQPELKDAGQVLRLLEGVELKGDMYLKDIHERVLKVVKQAEYLSQRYHVVVANPPYMGGKGMNADLGGWAKNNYPDSKSDLFAMFVERGLRLVPQCGYSAMVTMQSWMFLSSYEKLRKQLLDTVTINCMVHMANMVMGIAFGTAATVWHKHAEIKRRGHFSYVYYEDLGNDNEPAEFPAQNDRLAWASAANFKKIPGSPIVYWATKSVRDAFENTKSLGGSIYATPRFGND